MDMSVYFIVQSYIHSLLLVHLYSHWELSSNEESLYHYPFALGLAYRTGHGLKTIKTKMYWWILTNMLPKECIHTIYPFHPRPLSNSWLWKQTWEPVKTQRECTQILHYFKINLLNYFSFKWWVGMFIGRYSDERASILDFVFLLSEP